jgi:phospholipase/carboxylesterase
VPTEIESDLVKVDQWVFRVRKPANGSSDKVLLLLHGWTGDENSMWMFAEDMPEDYWVISPRAPFSAGEKGYSGSILAQPSLEEFKPSVDALLDELHGWAEKNSNKVQTIDLMGFSQGAGMVCAILLLGQETCDRAACLSGFLPAGGKEIIRPGILSKTKVFVAHGSADQMVPIERSHDMVESLQDAGAKVVTCTDDGGHRIGAGCFKGLKAFFNQS